VLVTESGPKTSPLAVDYTVELSSLSIDIWCNQDQDTPANQNSSDTNVGYEYGIISSSSDWCTSL